MGAAVFAGAMIVAVVTIEVFRRRRFGLLDFCFMFKAMFAVNYFVAPVLIYLTAGNIEQGQGAALVFYLPAITHRGLSAGAFNTALLWASIGYGAILGGYFAADRVLSRQSWWPKPLGEAPINARLLLVAASVLLFLASLALGLYIPSLRYQPRGSGAYYGFETFFRGIDMMRQQPTKFGFLKHLALLAMPASLMFVAVGLRRCGWISLVAWGLAAAAFFLTVTVLFHNSSRIEMIAYLVLLPLAAIVRGGRVNPYMAMLVFGMAGFWALFGDNMFSLFTSPKTPEVFHAALTQLVITPSRSLVSLLGQLSYPLVVLANTLHVVPQEVGYRWFTDLPFGAIYLLPKILIGSDWPQTLNLINGAMFGMPIPIDLLSLGVFSLGYLGLVLVAVLFGLLLRFLDGWLDPSGGWLVAMFRAAWLTYLPVRIMSADPYASLKSGFQLIVGTMILLAMVHLAARYSNADRES